MPYQCKDNLAGDKILKSRTFRAVANPVFAILAQALSFYLLWKLVRSLKFALVMWFGIRIFSLWVNMIQNYWTHTREFGYRRYHDDDDNAMNIGEWLPVTATFSACLQNNHHHYPGLLRLSHEPHIGIRLWICNRQTYEISRLGAGDGQGCGPAQGRAFGRAGFLGRSFSFCEGFNRLPEKAGRNFFAVQAVMLRPFLGVVISSKNFIDPRKMNGEILVDALFEKYGANDDIGA